jgi:DNA-binding GntR family transcriptional regulator
MLFHNEIGPDQKIYYRRLAEKLGMSNTPIIQALNQLELQGRVQREPNKGYYTEPVSMKQVKEIYKLRELIETSILPETISSLEEPGIEFLHSALAAHLEAEKQNDLNNKLNHPRLQGEGFAVEKASGKLPKRRLRNRLFVDLKSTEAFAFKKLVSWPLT